MKMTMRKIMTWMMMGRKLICNLIKSVVMFSPFLYKLNKPQYV